MTAAPALLPFSHPMTTPTLPLAATATAILDATSRASLPLPAPADTAVAARLTTLPTLAAAARDTDPAAPSLRLMVITDREDRATAVGVRTALDAAGVEHWTAAEAIHVSIPSLLAAAERDAAQRALFAIAAAWTALAGLGSTVDADARSGTLTLATPPGPRSRERHVVAPSWQARPPAEVVEEARAALSLPAWGLDALAAAWRLRAGAEAVCMVRRGLFQGAAFLPADDFTTAPSVPTVPALCFAVRLAVPPAVYALTAATCEASVEALVERAAQALGLAPVSPTASPARDDRRPLRARAASL